MKYRTDILTLFCIIFFISLCASASDWKVISQGTLDGGLTYEVVRFKDSTIRLEVKNDGRVLGELNVSGESSSAVLSPIHLPKGVDESDILLVCSNSNYFGSLRTIKTGEQSRFLCDNDGDGFPELQATTTKSGLMKEAVKYHFIPASNKTDNVEQSVADYRRQSAPQPER